MAHEVETMAYAGELPWHGLGTKFANQVTVDEARVAAGLDWEVVPEQLMLPSTGAKVDRWANVRTSDKKVLGTVGPGYRIYQNREAFEVLRPFIESGAATIESAGSLRGGQRVWVLAKVAIDDIEVVRGDAVQPYLLVANGHDGYMSIFTGETATRVVCANTLHVSLGGGRIFKIRHTKNAVDAVVDVQASLAKMRENFVEAAKFWRALAGVKATPEQIRAFVDKSFPDSKTRKRAELAQTAGVDAVGLMADLRAERETSAKLDAVRDDLLEAAQERKRRIADDILDLFNGGGYGSSMPGVAGTAWGAYNAATQWLTHERGKSADNRLNNAWFGAEGPRLANAAKAVFLG